MDTRRIARLLEPFLATGPGLSSGQLASISMYIDILIRWNRRINLTAIRGAEEVVTRHFGESLFAAAALFPDPAAPIPVVDVGSGAGFPGLPLRIWAPKIRLSLIEANQKKATFLREVCRALAFTDVDVLAVRAETVQPREAGLVTLRAVEHFERILEVSSELVRPGGRLALLIGARQEASATRVAPGYVWTQPLPVPFSRERILLVGTRW
jgi:16S rRNA (guanine527-N7)-methyltransferase